MACVGFSIIGLLNLGLSWEERTAFVETITWELQSQLALTKGQTTKIKEINYEFYDAVVCLQQQGTDEQIDKLINDKNTKILKVLSADQQQEWLKSHCKRSQEILLK